jgi:hypothetical protein
MPNDAHALSDAYATKFPAPPEAKPKTAVINNVICQDGWVKEVAGY